jgi:hypothetical protein
VTDQPEPDLAFVRDRLAVAADRAAHPLTPPGVRRAIRQARAEMDPSLPPVCPACGLQAAREHLDAHDCPRYPRVFRE